MLTLGAVAARADCPQHFLGGQVPTFTNAKMTERTQELCYGTFADLHSAMVREPLYAAEHLTAQSVAAARGSDRREMRFHPDPQLPEQDRAELSDYARSGYDRGHMANWADTADPDSFSLGNMVPQNPDNNRHLWEGVETSTRALASDDGEAWVISGPIFSGAQLQWLHGRVAIPNMLFKAVYDPRKGAGVYLTENAPGSVWRLISVEQLTQMTGMDPFPALPADVKRQVAAFPDPDVHGRDIPQNGEVTPSTSPGLGNKRESAEGGLGETAARAAATGAAAGAASGVAHELAWRAMHAFRYRFSHHSY